MACLSPEMVQAENIVNPITSAITPKIKFFIKFGTASSMRFSEPNESMMSPDRKANIGKDAPIIIEAMIPTMIRIFSVVYAKRKRLEKDMVGVVVVRCD